MRQRVENPVDLEELQWKNNRMGRLQEVATKWNTSRNAGGAKNTESSLFFLWVKTLRSMRTDFWRFLGFIWATGVRSHAHCGWRMQPIGFQWTQRWYRRKTLAVLRTGGWFSIELCWKGMLSQQQQQHTTIYMINR